MTVALPLSAVYYLVNTELKCIFNNIPHSFKISVLLYSQNCPPVVQPYLDHSDYFFTHRISGLIIL